MSRSDIDALNATLVQALKEGDAAMLASVYAPDARLMPPGAPMATGAGIREYWQAGMNMGIDGGVLKTTSFEEHDDTAIEVGQFEMRAGAQLIDTGKYVVVHRRQDDGSWKYAVDIWNSDGAVTAE